MDVGLGNGGAGPQERPPISRPISATKGTTFMAYITKDDIRIRLGNAAYVQMSDDEMTGSADEAVVDECRAAAEGELDSHLAVRHVTPIDVTAHPDLASLLKSVALDLAEYRMRLRRPPVAPDATRRHSLTADWLRRVAAGTIALPGSPTPTAREPVAQVRGAARVLTRDELKAH